MKNSLLIKLISVLILGILSIVYYFYGVYFSNNVKIIDLDSMAIKANYNGINSVVIHDSSINYNNLLFNVAGSKRTNKLSEIIFEENISQEKTQKLKSITQKNDLIRLKKILEMVKWQKNCKCGIPNDYRAKLYFHSKDEQRFIAYTFDIIDNNVRISFLNGREHYLGQLDKKDTQDFMKIILE